MDWLSDKLEESTAEWQIVVTHFPPTWRQPQWSALAAQHGIDLIITGHQHNQKLHYMADDHFGATGWIVTGGGGGIYSEATPRKDGEDDQYGFVDFIVTKEHIEVNMISHGGVNPSRNHPIVRNQTKVVQRSKPPPMP